MKHHEGLSGTENISGADRQLHKMVRERFPDSAEFSKMPELEQMTALSQIMFLPEVKENIELADHVAQLLSRLEEKRFGHLTTPHETAGMPSST